MKGKKTGYRILRAAGLSAIAIAARFYRLRHPDLWLFFSRPDERDGNAYALYKWVGNKKECFFVLDKHAAGYEAGMLHWNSIRHFFFSAAAAVHVFDVGTAGNKYGKELRRRFGLKTKNIFLQHGTMRVDIPTYHYDRTKFDLFVTTAGREQQFIHRAFGYPENRIALTGQARHDDLLKNAADKKFVLIMPTWRKELKQAGAEAFLSSEFFVRFQSLLNNEEFTAFLKTNGLKLRFYLHYEVKDKLALFSIPPDVEVYDQTDSVHELLRDCSLLITDYSSVSFDAALAGKPVIYYQFQKDQYNAGEGYFQYERDGFGPVVNEEPALVKELQGLWNGHCFALPAIYRARTESFFAFHDTGSCQRIYDRILALEENRGGI